MNNWSFNNNSDKWWFIFLCALFSLLFLHIFEPFGIYAVSNQAWNDIFWEINLAVIFAVIVLIVTQFGLTKVITSVLSLKFGFLLLFLLDIFLIGSVWFAITIIEFGINQSFLSDWMSNLVSAFFLFMIPYFASLVLMKTITIKHNKKLRENKAPGNIELNGKLVIVDENNVGKFTLKESNLLFIQSSDNYVTFYHLENEVIKKEMIRNTLKNIEQQLRDTSLLRCHRSFIVNTNNISNVKRTNSGLSLNMNDFQEFEIPVSKSYLSEIKKVVFNNENNMS